MEELIKMVDSRDKLVQSRAKFAILRDKLDPEQQEELDAALDCILDSYLAVMEVLVAKVESK